MANPWESGRSDSLRYSDRWKVSHLSTVQQMFEGRGGKKRKEQPSAVSSLVSVSTHSIIRVAPSDCLHSSLHHPAEAVLLQLAFKVGSDKFKTSHLCLLIQKDLCKGYNTSTNGHVLFAFQVLSYGKCFYCHLKRAYKSWNNCSNIDFKAYSQE